MQQPVWHHWSKRCDYARAMLSERNQSCKSLTGPGSTPLSLESTCTAVSKDRLRTLLCILLLCITAVKYE